MNWNKLFGFLKCLLTGVAAGASAKATGASTAQAGAAAATAAVIALGPLAHDNNPPK